MKVDKLENQLTDISMIKTNTNNIISIISSVEEQVHEILKRREYSQRLDTHLEISLSIIQPKKNQ